MRHFGGGNGIVLALIVLVTAGCGTVAQTQIDQALVKFAPADQGASVDQALADLESNPLTKAIDKDVADTIAWVKGKQAETPPMDPLKAQLALACPTAVNAVKGTIVQNLEALRALLKGVQTTGQGAGAPSPEVILFLTQLKYGDNTDPSVQVANLRATLSLQVDALFTGCGHLFPKKQVNDFLKAAVGAGLTVSSPGAMAIIGPAIGILP